jgi:hypothetical protein
LRIHRSGTWCATISAQRPNESRSQTYKACEHPLSDTRTTRAFLLWAAAGSLAAASVVLPRLLKLNEHFASGFVTAEAYGMSAGLLLSGIIMGAADPQRAARWGVVVGLAPLIATAVRMAYQGPGNLWPIAIFVALMLGVPAAAVGTFVAKTIRRRQPAGSSS